MAELLKGKPVADRLREQGVALIAQRGEAFRAPKLAIIRVGERPDDLFYEGGVKKNCALWGIDLEVKTFPLTVSQGELLTAVQALNEDQNVDGVLIFAPLPKTIDEKAIFAALAPEKDIDGLTTANLGGVFTGAKDAFAPCTPVAVMETLDYYGIPLQGKKVVVLGRSLVVGKPVAMLLLEKNATVTICHSRTENLAEVCRDADILVAAVGKARMVGKDFTHPGQVVIDVGINADPEAEGKICGDVDFTAVEPICTKITPVPAGIGSITTAVLLTHVTIAWSKKISASHSTPWKNVSDSAFAAGMSALSLAAHKTAAKLTASTAPDKEK